MYCFIYPILGVPWTSLNLSGPAKFLAKAVGMMERGAIGNTRNFVSGTTAPPGEKRNECYISAKTFSIENEKKMYLANSPEKQPNTRFVLNKI